MHWDWILNTGFQCVSKILPAPDRSCLHSSPPLSRSESARWCEGKCDCGWPYSTFKICLFSFSVSCSGRMTTGQVLWGTETGSCVWLCMWDKKEECRPFIRHGATAQHWITQYTVQVCMRGTHYSSLNVHLRVYDCNTQTTTLVVV